MCLIQRSVIVIKSFIAACCGPTGITYVGGETTFAPMTKARRGGKRHNRQPVVKTSTTPKKAPVSANVGLEADMSLPSRQMHANIEPIRIPPDADRYYFNYTHHTKRVLQKHRRMSMRVLSLQFLQ